MRILPCWVGLAVLATPLHAQALEDKITDLFIFGEGEQVLFLGGSGGSDNPTHSVHGHPLHPARREQQPPHHLVPPPCRRQQRRQPAGQRLERRRDLPLRGRHTR